MGGNRKTGDKVTFGAYPQGANGEIMPIEWTILDIEEDGCCVLISDYGLDAAPYNDEFIDITWEACTLRMWLNDAFYNTAFSPKERNSIIATCVANKDNAEYGTPGGKDRSQIDVWQNTFVHCVH